MKRLTENVTKSDKPKNDDEEQSKRFIETAKQLNAEKSGKKFEEAVKKITSTNKDKSAQ